MPEAVLQQQQRKVDRPPIDHEGRAASSGGVQVGQLHAVGDAVNGAPRVVALSALGTLISARPMPLPRAAHSAPVQRLLDRALPDGQFFKASIRPYQQAIDASLQDLRSNWRVLRNRYELLSRYGAVRARLAQYHTLATVDAPAIENALMGQFTNAKRDRLVAAYDRIRAAEGNHAFAAAQAELNDYVEVDQLPRLLNPRNRIIDDLEARIQAGGDDRLFEGGLRRNGDDTWNFWQANPAGGAGLQWTIHFATANTAAATIVAVIDAAARRMTVTLGRHPIPNAQSQVYERLIADAIAAQFRTHAGVSAANVFARAAPGGNATRGDLDRIETLRQLYLRYGQDEQDSLAAPDDAHRKIRMRGIVDRFSAIVEEMHLDDAGKRAVFAQIPGLEDAVNGHRLVDKAISHGMFHEMRRQSVARDLGNPLEDAGRTGVRVLTPELIEHMIAVNGRNGADFVSMGLNGGHDNARLLGFVAGHPRYALVAAAGGVREFDVPMGGATHRLQVRRYRQFIWQRAGDPPADAAQRPSADAVPADWTEAQVPKTTVDNLEIFLLEGRRTYLAWWHGNEAQRAQESFGRVPNAAAGVAEVTGDSGLTYAGFVRADAVHSNDALNAIRKLDTIFPTV